MKDISHMVSILGHVVDHISERFAERGLKFRPKKSIVNDRNEVNLESQYYTSVKRTWNMKNSPLRRLNLTWNRLK